METYPIVDHREDGPWTPSYELGCTCQNCGERHIAIFQKAQKPTPRLDECPHCEVQGMLLYFFSAIARELRAKNAQAHQPQPTPALLPAGARIYNPPGGM